MQRVHNLSIAGVVHPVALVFSKKELDALLSATGSRKSPADMRVLWLDYGRARATATNGSLALCLSVKDADVTDDGWDTVPVDVIAAALKGSKAGEAIIVGGDVTRIAVMRDFGCDDIVDATDVCSTHEYGALDTTLDVDAVNALFTSVSTGESAASHSFSFKGSVAHVIEKIAKATGDADVFCMMSPFGEGPLALHVEHEFDEKVTVFDLIVQPLS